MKTERRRSFMCGIGGTAGLVAICNRRAEDSQAMQQRLGREQSVHSSERPDQTCVHGRVPRRSDGDTSIRCARQEPVCDRSRGQGELPERCRRLGQFGIARVPRQWEPQLRQDQKRRLHVRAGLGGGGLPRGQDREAPRRLIFPPASSAREPSDGATSRHRHCFGRANFWHRVGCADPKRYRLPSLPPRA
jgi:hypothetical protein